MNKNITFAQLTSYDYRIMKQFSKLLKTNNIDHKYYRKDSTLVIDDGFKSVFKIKEKGYWQAWRLDKSVEMSQLIFSFPVNCNRDLIVKCARFKLIPYQVIKRLKL